MNHVIWPVKGTVTDAELIAWAQRDWDQMNEDDPTYAVEFEIARPTAVAEARAFLTDGGYVTFAPLERSQS